MRATSICSVVASAGPVSPAKGKRSREVAQLRRGGGDLPQPLVGDGGVQLGQEQLAAGGVLHAIEQLAQYAEARGHHPARRAGVHALGQYLHLQREIHEPAQRRRDPQPVVVAAPRVQRDHERWLAQLVAQRLEMCRQVGAARFLAGLDEHHAAAVGATGGADRFQRGDCRERGVAVVGAAPAVEPVAVPDRLPGPEPVAPTGERRLLVEVAIEHHRVAVLAAARAAAVGRRHVDQEQRRAAVELVHLDGGAGQRLGDMALAPLVQELGGAGHVAGFVPTGVIRDRDVGDADVVVQHREDVAVPELVDVSCGGVGVESHGPLPSRPVSRPVNER